MDLVDMGRGLLVSAAIGVIVHVTVLALKERRRGETGMAVTISPTSTLLARTVRSLRSATLKEEMIFLKRWTH